MLSLWEHPSTEPRASEYVGTDTELFVTCNLPVCDIELRG